MVVELQDKILQFVKNFSIIDYMIIIIQESLIFGILFILEEIQLVFWAHLCCF